jgi:acetyl esterase/lipase
MDIERNVVYGMYSGLALLMDVYRPPEPNSYGIVFIAGSGWHRPLAYGAEQLKHSQTMYPEALQAAGYTVFAINHRAAPRFRYPAAVEDAQRAVRFVRHHGAEYGIRAGRIGAAGGSSGGHLVSLLGTMDGAGDPADADPVNRESARVQCVVARAAPVDLANFGPSNGTTSLASFMGMPAAATTQGDSVEWRTYREASPITHVSADSAPFLLIHGDADETVPFEQSVLMLQALTTAGVPAELLCIEGGGHGPDFPGAKNAPDYLGAMVRWFSTHLQQ